MGSYNFTKKAQKAMQRVVRNRHWTVQVQGVDEYFYDNVRVDTGRMRSTIGSDYPNYNASGNYTESVMTIGGISAPGVLKDTDDVRMVDYVSDLYENFPADGELENIADNIGIELGDYVPL